MVAVVDDDPDVLRGIQRLLRAKGLVSEVFGSAEAFLSSTAPARATCLVLDVQLGTMDGFELQRRLADLGSDIPIVFMTAFDNEATQLRAIEAGCTAYLRKPFAARLLFDAIYKAST
ncbi:response regulator [Mesorhizobium sp. B2-4-14]|nr:response regulator [Mesorhizobium sp. B2-4-14]